MADALIGKLRIVCWFSCGAASAVATKLAIADNKKLGLELVIAYTGVAEEHSDNARFLADCEKWFDHPITVLGNDEYSRSIYEVFRRVRYLKGPSGAACTRLLKKNVRKAFERPPDVQVFGYTAEESDRAERFMDANNGVRLWTPLIDRGLLKADCLAMIKKAGIALPAMYALGYKNNNCIGCVKGEAGYWNKIRVDFPATFERMAQMEETLGRTVCKVEKTIDGVRTLKRISLRELPPDAGRYEAEPEVECGIFCELADKETT